MLKMCQKKRNEQSCDILKEFQQNNKVDFKHSSNTPYTSNNWPIWTEKVPKEA